MVPPSLHRYAAILTLETVASHWGLMLLVHPLKLERESLPNLLLLLAALAFRLRHTLAPSALNACATHSLYLSLTNIRTGPLTKAIGTGTVYWTREQIGTSHGHPDKATAANKERMMLLHYPVALATSKYASAILPWRQLVCLKK